MDGLIFDLDGTLWDATANICDAWNMALQRYYPYIGRLRQQDFFAQMGKPLHDIGMSLFSQVDDEQLISEIVERCCAVENDHLAKVGGVLYEGVQNTLAALAERLPLFIVSNCQKGYIEAFFSAHSLAGYFTDTQNGGNGLSKAENIRLVAERNGLTAPVYIGDTELDRESASSADVPFIWAAYGFGNVTDCTAKLDSFTQIPDLIERL